jgi:hypothetical protein
MLLFYKYFLLATHPINTTFDSLTKHIKPMENTRLRRYNRFTIPFNVAFVIAITQSCSPDFLDQNGVDAMFEEGTLTLDYEAEIVGWQETGDITKASIPDKIYGMAHAARSKVHAELYEDGTSAWRIEKLEPEHNVSVPDQTPPNPMPQTKITRIDRNGKGYFYSNTGTLLHEHDVPVQSCKELLARFARSKNPDIAYALAGVKGQQPIADIVTAAKADGATVQNMGGDIISISKIIPQTTFKNGRGSTTTYKGVDLYNEKVGILVGSELYDESEMLLSETFYVYRKNDDKQKENKAGKKVTIEPEVIYQKTYNKNPKTGERKVSITNTYFKTISAKTKKES